MHYCCLPLVLWPMDNNVITNNIQYCFMSKHSHGTPAHHC